jgi:hypothetical protein
MTKSLSQLRNRKDLISPPYSADWAREGERSLAAPNAGLPLQPLSTNQPTTEL